MRNHKYLFLFPLTYFTIGLINIQFSMLALICLILPFILLTKNKKKTWCQGYCPRASLYTTWGNVKKITIFKTPQFFLSGDMKWFMLLYFGMNLIFIAMTTLKVAEGYIYPMEYLRFLIYFPVPVRLPQLFNMNDVASWVTHLSYRFYSLMMTTTILGLILATIFKPRTWCTICPISTLSDVILNKKNTQ